MQRTQFDAMHCSIARCWHLVGEPWTPLVLRDLFVGMRRFDTICEDLGIARNVLADRLRRLVDGGLVAREPYRDGGRTRDEYVLTEAGWDLAPILMLLMAWGDRWTASVTAPPMRLRHDPCGHVGAPRVTCSGCGESLNPREVTAIAGPGGKTAPGTARIGEFVERPARTRGRSRAR